MRIIAGAYRGRNLKSPPSVQVRPTSDRLRETLFNVIAPRIQGTQFLDLCAGSGAVGIEALSRGATHATFVDRSPRMVVLVKANLELCSIPRQKSEVIQLDAERFLKRSVTRNSNPWDIIFYDPPYADSYTEVLDYLGSEAKELLAGDGLLIAEHSSRINLKDEIGRMIRTRVLKQGDSALSFYKMKGS